MKNEERRQIENGIVTITNQPTIQVSKQASKMNEKEEHFLKCNKNNNNYNNNNKIG